ncbi:MULTISPECIES: acyl carrier protein [Paenibacillus]|uniref:D-alanyl carrier protein n=1 Tax=Paenibacillus borealis TaxID=160799 RepID=A0ABX3GS46_PAEBO|nr:phosphopantetheine-binding protein [Paenibacillus borealis]OMD35879.1 D-alanyl carrier protein [Paenibacillus borealis]
MSDIKSDVRAFLSRYVKNQDIQDDEDIFSSGAVNSLFAMQLIMYLESRFSIRITNQEMNPDNFKSINSIEQTVNRLLA